MHPDSLKSVVYRSFVTCDDPKGVVECGTIRKSKSSSQKMEHKIDSSRKAKKKSDASLSYKKAEKKEEIVSEGITEEFRSPSSFQLLKVSRGAQKLNGMVDSWSKGKSYDGQSKDVAKDMLKGALDLQESLVMLGKLQEASQYKAWLKKKQKEMSKRGKNDQVGIERANSYHFGDQNYQMEFQKPRLSTDGASPASRDCYEELREVIRDSLARQNLLPKTQSEEMMAFHRRRLDSSSDIPSTSSSQSSITQTSNYSSTGSPLSFTAPKKKPKGPNLIAKLMGLEEIPSNPLQSTLPKQMKDDKFSSQQRPMFDYDMPKVTKPQFVRQRDNPERKTLKEILETMHSTGVLKSDSVNKLQSCPYQSCDLHSKERLIGNMSPIVLIRPRCDQFLESEETFVPMSQEKGVQDTKLRLRKLKVKEELPSRTSDCKEGSLNSGKTNRKTEEENSIKRLSKERENKSKDMIRILGEKEVKIKQKCCDKVISSGHVTHQPQKKEAIDKKDDKITKTMVGSRKPIEKEIVKSKNVSRSQDQAKVNAMKVRKPDNGSNATKNQILHQQNSTLNAISNRTKQTVNNTSNDRKRPLVTRQKLVTEPTTDKLTTENVVRREDDKRISFVRKEDSVPVGDNNTCVDQLPAEKDPDASGFQITESCNNSQRSLSEANILTSKDEGETELFFEEINDDINHIRLESESFKTGTNLKAFLSSSLAFLSHAEELFDLNVDSHTTVQTSGTNDFVISNERLSMDCANELMKRRSLPDSKTSHPLLLTWLRNSRIHLSLEELLEEICDGVETLRSYTELAGEKLSTDSLCAVLERDIGCHGIVSGIWDLGWRNELSVEDTEKAVNDIEKLLLSGLIDEILKELLL